MKEFKGTKEEWLPTFNISKERGVRTSGGFICFLPKPSHYHGQDDRYERELEENKANANLIATAPELLEACLEFVRKVDCGEARSIRSYKQMKSAIDKALKS